LTYTFFSPTQIYEDNELQAEKERNGIPNFWDWQNKILTQQIDYFGEEKDKLRNKMLAEI
jgi:hypothetical protein